MVVYYRANGKRVGSVNVIYLGMLQVFEDTKTGEVVKPEKENILHPSPVKVIKHGIKTSAGFIKSDMEKIGKKMQKGKVKHKKRHKKRGK